ncbi:MAG TPA: hypothetical protein VGP82_18020 [Ktedonobacterales bacterium]|nr:hypothetical protein [Ktedonobacterales bacterium]
MTSTSRASTARYRVWQMWRSFAVRGLGNEDRAILDATLPPGGRALFATMSLNDQRHSLTVYRALRARGCDDPDLLAAALLHDSGKGNGRVRLWVRPPFVLLHVFVPAVLRWLASAPAPWWRRPFYNAWHHAEIGARCAAEAGLSERTALLIRTHHQPDGPAAELHAVDDAL